MVVHQYATGVRVADSRLAFACLLATKQTKPNGLAVRGVGISVHSIKARFGPTDELNAYFNTLGPWPPYPNPRSPD